MTPLLYDAVLSNEFSNNNVKRSFSVVGWMWATCYVLRCHKQLCRGVSVASCDPPLVVRVTEKAWQSGG